MSDECFFDYSPLTTHHSLFQHSNLFRINLIVDLQFDEVDAIGDGGGVDDGVERACC